MSLAVDTSDGELLFGNEHFIPQHRQLASENINSNEEEEEERREREENPYDHSPPCSSASDSETCSSLVDCQWCGTLLDRPSWKCFEISLWRCPRRPECQRSEPELYGFRTGTPAPVVIVISIACFIVTALLFKRRCADHFRPKRSRIIVRRDSVFTSAETEANDVPLNNDNESIVEPLGHEEEDHAFTYVLLEHVNPPKKLNFLARFDRMSTRILLVFATAVSFLCIFVLVLSPAPPVFTACDIRWDLRSLDKENGGSLIQILAEVSLSIWNPNRFDIDVESARGDIIFDDGVVARFHYEPRGGYARIASGHVMDTRVVISVDWSAVQKVPRLIADWTSVNGIVLFLDANAYMRFRILGMETPALSLFAGGIPLPLNDVSRDLCRCTTP